MSLHFYNHKCIHAAVNVNSNRAKAIFNPPFLKTKLQLHTGNLLKTIIKKVSDPILIKDFLNIIID